MTRRYVPKGTCVVLMRHARSKWNQETTTAKETNAEPPERLPGKRDAELTAQGRVEAFFAGEFLGSIVRDEWKSDNVDLLAYSTRNRATETVAIAFQAAGLRPRYAFQSSFLDERHHSQFNNVDLRRIQRQLAEVVDVRSQQDAFQQLMRSLDAKRIGGRDASPGAYSLAGMAPHVDPDVLLTDFISDVGVQLFINFREAYDYQFAKLAEFGELRTPEQRRSSALAYAMASVQSRYAPSLANWIDKERSLNPHLRRKTPAGENLHDMRMRAERVLEVMGSYAGETYGARTFILVSHSLFMLVLRQLIEDFDDNYLDRVLTSEGPPFPPHTGAVIYCSHRGYLALQGDSENPYRLAPELATLGRRLIVRGDTDRARVQLAAKATGALSALKPVTNGQETVQAYEFEEEKYKEEGRIDDRPGLVAFGTRRLEKKRRKGAGDTRTALKYLGSFVSSSAGGLFL